MNKLSTLPFHPFLLALYAPLALLAYNLHEVRAAAGLRTLLLCLSGALLLALLLRLFIRNWRLAGLIASLLITLFLSYGHAYNFIGGLGELGASLGRHRLLLPLYLILLAAGSWLLLRKLKDPLPLTQALNLVGVVLLVFPLAQVIQTGRQDVARPANATASVDLGLSLPANPPDIYYIVVDGYARDDVLQDLYDLDNQEFIDDLRALGFFVPRCAQSNYAQTQLSLPSSLNFDYLANLSPDFHAGSSTREGLAELIRHSAVRQVLESLGYETVAFETGFRWTEWEDAGLYLSPQTGSPQMAYFLGGMNAFEELFLRTTAGLAVLDGAVVLPQVLRPDTANPKRIHRERILYVLDQLERLPERDGPQFIFAHLVIPHPPYVFDSDGTPIDHDQPDMPGYPNQVRYLNSRLIPLLESIMANSPTPPVILLQADHGAIKAPPARRMNILSAYFLPGNQAALTDTLTPVNSFRVVLNRYFGGDLSLLPDESLFSSYQAPYDTILIQDARPGCGD